MPDLFDLSHSEARARAREGAPVFLFANPVEYHGPHLSLHNDRHLSYGLAQRLARDEGWPFIVAGHIEMGVDPCPGPGTQFSSYRAVRSAVLEACRALAELGAEKVVLMTFHGAPLHNAALEAGAEWLRSQGIGAVAPFHVIVEKLLDLDDPTGYMPAIEAAAPDQPREELLRWLGRDMHAGFFETSLALHLAPATVGEIRSRLPPCPDITPIRAMERAGAVARRLGRERLARELEFGAFAIAWTNNRPFTGYTSRPAAATGRSGEVFADEIIREYRDLVPGVLDGAKVSPGPLMSWLPTWSLQGRLAVAHPIGEQALIRIDG